MARWMSCVSWSPLLAPSTAMTAYNGRCRIRTIEPAPIRIGLEGVGDSNHGFGRAQRHHPVRLDHARDAGRVPEIELRHMRAALVAARHERDSCSCHFPKRLRNVLAATDFHRIDFRADQDEIVVHHGEALDTVTLGEEFFLG